MVILEAIQSSKKTGQESFIFEGKETNHNVLSFWQWSNSDLLGNSLRGILAEYIVASAIGVLQKPREEWEAYDLVSLEGLKIEIKSSSYLQSWEQNKFSKILFGIKPTVTWQNDDKKRAGLKRQADLYVFCVLSHKDKDTVNPLDLSQWDFYLLKTAILNEFSLTQKTITLPSLLKLKPLIVKYDGLKQAITKCV